MDRPSMEGHRGELTKKLDRAAEAALKSLKDDGVVLTARQVADIGFGVVSVVSAAIAAPKEGF